MVHDQLPEMIRKQADLKINSFLKGTLFIESFGGCNKKIIVTDTNFLRVGRKMKGSI